MPGKPPLFDRPNIGRDLTWALCVICAALLLLEFIVQRHVGHSWENWLAFYPLYGFLSCVLLVLLSSVLRRLAKRSEDYYSRAAPLLGGERVGEATGGQMGEHIEEQGIGPEIKHD